MRERCKTKHNKAFNARTAKHKHIRTYNIQADEYTLASEIVRQAIFDWQALDAGLRTLPSNVTYAELRRFFLGEWCDLLLSVTGADLTGAYILKLLDDGKLNREY